MVGPHGGSSPCSYPRKSLHERTGRRRTVHVKRFEEQVAGTCSKNPNQFEFDGLVAVDVSRVKDDVIKAFG